MKKYWNKRFEIGGRIWGDTPSDSTRYALELFKKKKIKDILIFGAGYGRNSKLFVQEGYNVVGIEISEKACNLAKEFNPQTNLINASVLNLPLSNKKFEAIFCFNILHLFLERERKILLKNTHKQLKNRGLAFFTLFSEEESSYKKGKTIEENTFESKPGRPTHYFSKEDLLEHFKDFIIIEVGMIDEKEDHGGKEHIHKLRYILVEKNNKK